MRLTKKRADNGRYYLSGLAEVLNSFPKGYGLIQVGHAVDKLAEYEDLEEQNRLMKLPCAVGDMVYLILYEYTPCTPYGERFEESSCCGCGAWECDSKREYYIKEQNVFNLEWIVRNMEQSNFGKTAFLTREEAESALKELERGKGE